MGQGIEVPWGYGSRHELSWTYNYSTLMNMRFVHPITWYPLLVIHSDGFNVRYSDATIVMLPL